MQEKCGVGGHKNSGEKTWCLLKCASNVKKKSENFLKVDPAMSAIWV